MFQSVEINEIVFFGIVIQLINLHNSTVIVIATNVDGGVDVLTKLSVLGGVENQSLSDSVAPVYKFWCSIVFFKT